MQIGLGTNSTFIQNLAGEWHEWDISVDWLLRVSSEQRPHKVRGIAVEPVSELVANLHRPAERLPNVELVQVAMGEHEVWGAEVSVFSLRQRDALLRQVPWSQRASLQHDLEYILNMSSVGDVHPMVPGEFRRICKKYNIKVDVTVGRQQVDVWTWQRLAKQCKFRGCEVLLIDTEGYDAQILRSLKAYCRDYPDTWPLLIQFETMGHCDRIEGEGTEWDVIEALEQEGYVLVNYSYHNTHLVLKRALRTKPRLKKWVGGWRCSTCTRSWQLPYATASCGMYCQQCIHQWKRSPKSEQWSSSEWLGPSSWGSER